MNFAPATCCWDGYDSLTVQTRRTMRSIHAFVFALAVFLVLRIEAQQTTGILIVEVRSDSGPAEQADVVFGTHVATTDQNGEASLELPAGDAELTIQRYGLKTQRVRATVVAGATTRLSVELESEAILREEITVTASRTEVRIEDIPLRVEVLEQE